MNRLVRCVGGYSIVLVLCSALAAAIHADDAPPADDSPAALRAAMVARIDALVAARLQAEGIEPVAQSSDGEFMRRVYLDLAGAVPRVPDVRAFLADHVTDEIIERATRDMIPALSALA